jgi:parvulin-like peptidyl-prolyl isomerase
MIVNGVQRREVMEKLGLTEEEARKYHAEHIEEFTTPGTITLREIFVAVASDEKGVNVATDEATQAKIEDLRRRAAAGEDFAKLAGEVSDAPSRANGGLLGPLTQTELAPALQEQLTKMKPGEISEPIRLPRGYLIVKLESVTEPEVQPAEKVRDQIAERLWERKRRAELGKYLTRIRSEALIEWKNEELRKAYESAIQATGAPPEAGKPSSPSE